MNKPILKASILYFLSSLCMGASFGQAAKSDSTYVQDAKNQAITNFEKAIGQQSRLYSGHEYLLYNRIIKGTALFPLDAETWAPGEVNYDGIHYKNVPMMYDVYKDAVVVLLYNGFSRYSLLNERVHDFTLSDHHFIRIVADSITNNNAGISTGFYDQLYSGKTEVLAKRIKTLENSMALASLETFFREKHEYYVKKGNIYYSAGSQRSFLNALKDKKKVLQQYIKDSHIRFNNDPENAMIKIASYYDHLSN